LSLFFVLRGASSIPPVGRSSSIAQHFPSHHLVDTTHHGHAHDIAKDLATNYDAVVAVSGDGLVHEVLNGFAEHVDPIKAFSIPVAPIPTGSGNGLSLNLLGLEVSGSKYHQVKLSHAFQDGFDVTKAALNAIKGAHVFTFP
jgi:sphingosine kinase